MIRRLATAFGGVFLLVATSVSPVAADTTGGGTQLVSESGSCTATVCTETTVSAFLDPFGSSACFDIATYDANTKDQISDEQGCAGTSSFAITSGLVATLGPTSIGLELCDNNGCTPTRTVVVSASDSPTGPITTSSGKSTTKDGFCTTKTKFTDSSADVAGTYTVDGTTTNETGFAEIHHETSKTTCRS
jgi:hypothetical protein